MKYSDVREIRRCATEQEANELLATGWELLNMPEVRSSRIHKGRLRTVVSTNQDIEYILGRARWSEGQTSAGEPAAVTGPWSAFEKGEMS